jgi:hypothetical protein
MRRQLSSELASAPGFFARKRNLITFKGSGAKGYGKLHVTGELRGIRRLSDVRFCGPVKWPGRTRPSGR